jgi:hypothetical protein
MIDTINKSFKNIDESVIVLFLSQTNLMPVCNRHFPSFYEELLEHDYLIIDGPGGQNDVLVFEVNKQDSDIKKACLITIKLKDYIFEEPAVVMTNLKQGLKTLVEKTLPSLLKGETKDMVGFTDQTGVAIKMLGPSSLLNGEQVKEVYNEILGESKFSFKVYVK